MNIKKFLVAILFIMPLYGSSFEVAGLLTTSLVGGVNASEYKEGQKTIDATLEEVGKKLQEANLSIYLEDILATASIEEPIKQAILNKKAHLIIPNAHAIYEKSLKYVKDNISRASTEWINESHQELALIFGVPVTFLNVKKYFMNAGGVGINDQAIISLSERLMNAIIIIEQEWIVRQQASN